MTNLLRILAACIGLLACATPAQADVSLMVYDFNLGLTPAGNVDHVRVIGFKGIVTGVRHPADIAKLQDYANHVATIQGFELFAYVTYNFNDPNSVQVVRDALPILASRGAPLWLIVENSPSPVATRMLLDALASESELFGIRTVIYPHWNTSIESAAEAAALLAQIAHPNLSNSLHTCHEIRAGNQYDLPATAGAHAQDSAIVTIAGADKRAFAGPFPAGGYAWDDAIQPLAGSEFDLLPFLIALQAAGYDGPVVLHTFGITSDPGHLKRSLRKYAEYATRF